MDKPRHPQVIRPWRTQQTQKTKWSAPLTKEQRRERSKKPDSRRDSCPPARLTLVASFAKLLSAN
jgi:hypothetical protein